MPMIASHCFSMRDQELFAELSGDRNPMHLDVAAARRTEAGTPVVYGIAVLLWSLEQFFGSEFAQPVTGLDARFERFVTVGEEVTLQFAEKRGKSRLEIRSKDDLRLIAITLIHDETRSDSEIGDMPVGELQPLRVQPVAVEPQEAAKASGSLEVAVTEGNGYPQASVALGTERISAMAALSYLVGMEVPGLHSIFSTLELDFVETPRHLRGKLAYRATDFHDIFRLLSISVGGSEISGEIGAFVRQPPVVQPGMSQLRDIVPAGMFAGRRALVIGGSRGLGEVAAKMLALGGADIAISYVTGKDDARRVAEEITDAGYACSVFAYDALQPAAPQLATIDGPFDLILYFATTKIFLQKKALYSPQIFDRFKTVYVDAFHDLCQSVSGRANTLVFYPSSVAVEDRPKDMTEYAMAKIAGETMCEDIDRHMPGVGVSIFRLPRLLTDQTATVTPVETDPVEQIMLEALEKLAAAAGG